MCSLYRSAIGRTGLLVAILFLSFTVSAQVCNDATACGFFLRCTNADLTPRHTWISGGGVAGESISIGGRVRNCGQNVAPPTTMQFYLSEDDQLSSDDYQLHSRNIGSVNPCDLSPVIQSNPILPCVEEGYWYLLVVADANNDLLANGCNFRQDVSAKRTYISAEAPDLRVTFTSPDRFAFEEACPGPTFVQATVRNFGGCAPASRLGVFFCDQPDFFNPCNELIGSVNVPAMDAGQTRSVFLQVTLPFINQFVAERYLIFKADYLNAVTESFENNNVGIGSLEMYRECTFFRETAENSGKASELDQTTGAIIPLSEDQVSIYPNPVNSIVNITYPSTDLVTRVNLYDLNGRQLRSLVIDQYDQTGNLELEVSDLPNGIYLLQFQAGDQVITKKLFKQ